MSDSDSSNGSGGAFAFAIQCGEAIGDRIVRCCRAALADGPMGERDRHDFYRGFIAAGQESSDQAAEALTHVRTSCAMFVRAVRLWCGAPATGHYVPGTGMFVSMGKVGFLHPAWVKQSDGGTPNPGDYFYIAPSQAPSDTHGHTGIILAVNEDGSWDTAEGGGGDGTLCQLRQRTLAGNHFADDGRTLWGWFDCTKVGLPESPACTDEAATPDADANANANEGASNE